MHHEKIASTFLKKCEEDKKWKEKNKSILLYQGENMSTFLKKCRKKKSGISANKMWQFGHDF